VGGWWLGGVAGRCSCVLGESRWVLSAGAFGVEGQLIAKGAPNARQSKQQQQS
jgi:hypothetical protein